MSKRDANICICVLIAVLYAATAGIPPAWHFAVGLLTCHIVREIVG